MIKKVKALDGMLKKIADDQGLNDDDLVLISIEKIEGSPTQYLQDKFIRYPYSPSARHHDPSKGSEDDVQ